jgi:hypothetical protein
MDMTELTGAFHDCVNEPENEFMPLLQYQQNQDEDRLHDGKFSIYYKVCQTRIPPFSLLL